MITDKGVLLTYHDDKERREMAEPWVDNAPGKFFFLLLQAGYSAPSIKDFIYRNFNDGHAELSLDHSKWDGKKVYYDLGGNNDESESDDSDYLNNIKSLKDGEKKKEKADKNFDVEVKSMGSVWKDEELSDSEDEEADTTPKYTSASDIIVAAKIKWREHLKEQEAAAQVAAEKQSAEEAAAKAASAKSAAEQGAAGQEAKARENAEAQQAYFNAQGTEKAAKPNGSADNSSVPKGTPMDTANENMSNDGKVPQKPQGHPGKDNPSGAPPSPPFPQPGTTPVTPIPTGVPPAASVRGAGQGA